MLSIQGRGPTHWLPSLCFGLPPPEPADDTWLRPKSLQLPNGSTGIE